LLSLCCVFTSLLFLLGIYSSQFVVFEVADHDFDDDIPNGQQSMNARSSSTLANTQPLSSSSSSSAPTVLLIPSSYSSYRRHLFALKCYRFSQLHPLSVLAFFLAIFLWSSMFNVSFMNYYTNVSDRPYD
jgi:hypothetical protein